MPKISIIIPVYNTGRILNRTINSVLKQSFKDFELLLINDGSNSETVKICEELLKKDKRIKLINKDNGGLCSARNLGIQKANGEYITFLDHDDEYEENLLEDNYKLANKYNADIIKFGYKYIDCCNNEIVGERKSRGNIDELLILDRKMIKEKYYYLNDNKILVYIWDAMYKRDFILKYDILFDLRYTIGREDIAYNINVYKYISKLVYNPQIYYKYYAYNNSTYNGISKEKYLKYFDDMLENFYIENKLLLDLNIENIKMGYISYRKLLAIMDMVGFLVEHIRNLSIRNILYFLKCFYSKYTIEKSDIKKGWRYLTIKQKIIIYLYYNKNLNLIAFLIKIYSKFL